TRFSQVLCQRSSSKGTKRTRPTSLEIGGRTKRCGGAACCAPTITPKRASAERGEILRPFQPVIGLEVLELRAVEGSPQRGCRFHPRGPTALDVMARVADKHRARGRRSQALERLEHGLGVGLGVRHLVRAHDHCERVLETRELQPAERPAAHLARDEAERLPLMPQRSHCGDDAVIGPNQRVVMLEVVSAVGGDHRFDLRGIVGPIPELHPQRRAEAFHPHLVRRLEPTVRAHGVAIRAEDQLDRVDQRAILRPILLLGIGHVLFATVAVAWVAHLAVAGLPWASAFALGAVVSPPDVAAATAFLRRLPLPRRLVTILEGESMINDAAAIVAYRMAVAAAVTGSFSFTQASGRFLLVGAGGIAVGLAVAWLLGLVRRRIHDPEVENTISLLTGYAAYLPAEHLGVSGILAVVV